MVDTQGAKKQTVYALNETRFVNIGLLLHNLSHWTFPKYQIFMYCLHEKWVKGGVGGILFGNVRKKIEKGLDAYTRDIGGVGV